VLHEPKNLAASVRQKLFDLARSRNEDFGLMLVRYGLERILYRLSRSKHRDTFVLKGALLFELWTKRTYRATRDADFLARGDNSPERFVFYNDTDKKKQWTAFCTRNATYVTKTQLKEVIEYIERFLAPVAGAVLLHLLHCF
jgi:Nucleotidyl transferase AbiEii toxin, Type IV TA system